MWRIGALRVRPQLTLGWKEVEEKKDKKVSERIKEKKGKLRLLGLGRQLEGTNRLTWTIWDAILRWMLIGWMLASGNTQEKYLHLLPRRILGPPSPTTNAHLSTLFLLLFSLFIFFFFSWNLCFMFFFFSWVSFKQFRVLWENLLGLHKTLGKLSFI